MEIACPEKSGISAERLSKVETLMNRYVDQGLLAGAVTCVARKEQVVHFQEFGYLDLNSKASMRQDTIFRIYSMTKPITSMALMILYEDSLFNLTDLISDYIPAFTGVKVFGRNGELVEPLKPITIQDLLRHTAGLSYGGFEKSRSAVDQLYDDADLFNKSLTNQEITERIASLPLIFHPGTKWHYSMATDVIGSLVEILSDMSLADFMQEKIFDPLGMVDTAFQINPAKLDRFPTLYGKTPESALDILDEAATSAYLPPVITQAGGHGLVSTTGDYLQFAQCILNKGAIKDAHLLSPKTVEIMTCNHLPISLLPIAFEGSLPMMGMGFGLGFGIMLDPAQAGMMGTVGDLSWGGNGETYFWIDPQEALIAILMSQYSPPQTYPLRQEFRTAVYQALIA